MDELSRALPSHHNPGATDGKRRSESCVSDSRPDSEHVFCTCPSPTPTLMDRISPKSLTHLREYWTPLSSGVAVSPLRSSGGSGPAAAEGEGSGQTSEEGREESTGKESEEKREDVVRAVFFRDRRPSAVYFTPDKAEGFPWLTWNFLIHVSERSWFVGFAQSLIYVSVRSWFVQSLIHVSVRSWFVGFAQSLIHVRVRGLLDFCPVSHTRECIAQPLIHVRVRSWFVGFVQSLIHVSVRYWFVGFAQSLIHMSVRSWFVGFAQSLVDANVRFWLIRAPSPPTSAIPPSSLLPVPDKPYGFCGR